MLKGWDSMFFFFNFFLCCFCPRIFCLSQANKVPISKLSLLTCRRAMFICLLPLLSMTLPFSFACHNLVQLPASYVSCLCQEDILFILVRNTLFYLWNPLVIIFIWNTWHWLWAYLNYCVSVHIQISHWMGLNS